MSVPPLPRIDEDADLYMDVLMHKSLKRPAAYNDKYGDTDRLAVLGREVIDLAVTCHLFDKRPHKDAREIESDRSEVTTPGNISTWLDSYGLKQKLRVDPSQYDSILHEPSEMTQFFYTYVGAIYYLKGIQTAQNWISGLIDPDSSPPQHQHGQMVPPSPMSQSGTLFYGAPQPVGAPPPLPASSPPVNTSAMSLVTLSLVNQTASQKGVQVTYPASHEGPPHQPIWTVRCCMNGTEKGIGHGKSQKLAKEEAARQAWAAMGWGPT